MSLSTLGEKNPPESLIVFDRFRVDDDLPKFSRDAGDKDQNSMKAKGSINIQQGNWSMSPDEDMDSDEETSNPDSRRRASSKQGKKKSWWAGMWRKAFPPPPPPPPVSVKYVFDLVLANPEELKVFDDRNAALREMLDNAKAAGQKSLVDQIEKEWEVRKFENALFVKGRRRYISEAQLLAFVKGCERGLCLDWIRNFTRPIPKEVVEAKGECDVDGFFDNYVVLHFDPKDKATTKKDREEEAAKRRDPILFGVMRGSRKLYFVGDWKDKFCDLTFQQIVDKLGKPLEMK